MSIMAVEEGCIGEAWDDDDDDEKHANENMKMTVNGIEELR